MPWIVKKIGNGPRPWKILREDTGKVVGSSTSRKKALGSMRARYASIKGKEKL